MALTEFGRYLNVFSSVYFGATCKYPSEWQRTADALVNYDQSECSNPRTEDVYGHLATVCRERNIVVPGLKRDWDVSKSDVITYYASFADSHRLPLHPIYNEHSDRATALVEQIENSVHKPFSVSKQLEIALDLTGSNLTSAVVILALATRAVGRGMDTRIVPQLSVTPERMENWGRCVSQFPDSHTGDAVGDTYHFWHGVHAGMSVGEPGKQGKERLKAFVCGGIYRSTAWATEIFRYRLTPEVGRTHKYADMLGYDMGVRLVHQFQ